MERAHILLLMLAAFSSANAANAPSEPRYELEHGEFTRTTRDESPKGTFEIRASLTRREKPQADGFRILRSNLSAKAVGGGCVALPSGIFRDGFE